MAAIVSITDKASCSEKPPSTPSDEFSFSPIGKSSPSASRMAR